MIGQYFVLGYVNKQSKEAGDYKKLHIKLVHKAVALSLYGLTVINVFVIVQMVVLSRYAFAFLIMGLRTT
jgi:hypothetical protein